MNQRDAVALIADAIPQGANQLWADFGAGGGTFTRALIELLGPGSRVYAVDRDATALKAIDLWPSEIRQSVVTVRADLTEPFDLPGLGDALLDGAIIANTLHFIRDAGDVLASLAARVKPGGRVVIVEYEHRGPNHWVPYPISSTRLGALASAAGLSQPTVTATRASQFGGELYVAVCDRVSGDRAR